jgi:hypothetical protein
MKRSAFWPLHGSSAICLAVDPDAPKLATRNIVNKQFEYVGGYGSSELMNVLWKEN